MKIGAFSEITDIPVVTIRYYMSLGLLVPKKINHNWEFEDDEVKTANQILRFKKCGFSLEEIAFLLKPLSDEANSLQIRDEIFQNAKNRIITKRKELEGALNLLEESIGKYEKVIPGEVFHGIPLSLFGLLECPYCSEPLEWTQVTVKSHKISSGEGICSCGFKAKVKDGILVAGNSENPIIKPVDTKIMTLRNRSPKDTSYIESFNQWLMQRLEKKNLNRKVIFEDVLNTYCFLNRALPSLRSRALYILCDTDMEVVKYYADSIYQACPDAQVMFIVDDGIHHPLKKGCLDIVIDYAASEVYQKFGYPSASGCLMDYVHKGTVILGRFSQITKRQPGARDPKESNQMRYHLPTLLEDMKKHGIHIDDEKYGEEGVDPRIYTGCLPGDVIKPYAFAGTWTMNPR